MAEARTQDETARALLALPSEWTVLEDVVWPGREPADIDDVVVGPGGVFVIVSSRSGKAAAASRAASAVLARGARLHRSMVHAVVCSTEPQRDDLGPDILRCTPETIVALLLGRPRVLERDELHTASATVTTQVRLKRSVRRRSTGSTGRLAIFLLIAAATVATTPWAAARLEAARAGDPPPVPQLGETIRLASTPSRSPLDLTVEHVDAPGPTYAVRLTVRDDGSRSFDMGTLEVGLTLDNLHQADPVGRPQAELAGAELLAGKERVLTYRFELPGDRHPQLVAVVVGDRRGEQVRWQVP